MHNSPVPNTSCPHRAWHRQQLESSLVWSWDQLKLYQLSLGGLEMQLVTLPVVFRHKELVSCKTAAPVRRRMSYSTVSAVSWGRA